MRKSVEIELGADEQELAALFSYPGYLSQSALTTLSEFIGYGFNQTLRRDRFYGGWAEVLEKDCVFTLKLNSPVHNLLPYRDLIGDYLAAIRTGLAIYRQLDIAKSGLQFMIPFGLCQATTRSVQLLHFPPIETYAYRDYLFSPTNRRWENLLTYNKVKGEDLESLETIVDCVPLTAAGGAGAQIAPYNFDFIDYGRAMLRARLDFSKGVTQPVVAYGSPVRKWLEKAFPQQITGTLGILSLVEVRLSDRAATTSILCANHPSEYLYYTSRPDSREKREIMTQDLIAAGWQAAMAKDPSDDPAQVLKVMQHFWTGNPLVEKIMAEEDREFSFNL